MVDRQNQPAAWRRATESARGEGPCGATSSASYALSRPGRVCRLWRDEELRTSLFRVARAGTGPPERVGSRR